jgi:hypothetical protein
MSEIYFSALGAGIRQMMQHALLKLVLLCQANRDQCSVNGAALLSHWKRRVVTKLKGIQAHVTLL